MSLLEPNIPAPVDVIDIDAAILDLQYKLTTNLSWLSNGYGRAYSHLRIPNTGKQMYYPEVYSGVKKNGATDGQAQYYRVTFDSSVNGMSFFVVGRENINDFQENLYNYLNYDLGIIFQVNLDRINSAWLETSLFTQNLIAEVRELLSRNVHEYYKVSVNNIVRTFKDVYKEFALDEKEGYNKAPHQLFRFNCTLSLPESCPIPLDRDQALINNLTLSEILNTILPTIDFSNPNAVAALTAQQRIDLGI